MHRKVFFRCSFFAVKQSEERAFSLKWQRLRQTRLCLTGAYFSKVYLQKCVSPKCIFQKCVFQKVYFSRALFLKWQHVRQSRLGPTKLGRRTVDPNLHFIFSQNLHHQLFAHGLGSVVALFKRAKSYDWVWNILNKEFYLVLCLIFAGGHFYLKLATVSNLDKTDAKCVSSIIHKKRARGDKKWQIEFEKHKFSPTE